MNQVERDAVLKAGHAAAALVSQSGYKDLLDDIEKTCNAKLAALRGSRYAPAEMVKAALHEWMRWEELLHEAQKSPYTKIQAAEELIRQEQAEKEALLRSA